MSPPYVLLHMRHQGQRITQTDVTNAVTAERAAIRAARRNKRKAS